MVTSLIARLRRGGTVGEADNDRLRDALAEVRAAVAALEARVAEIEGRGVQRSAKRSGGARRESAAVTALRDRVRALLAAGCSQAEAARRLGITRQYVHKLIRTRAWDAVRSNQW